MSPVWIKLGDFGVSKRILAQATTTFHTQVSTPVYSAPEVLGLDSNSETSDYTNSVDIWSLGCVIYELLVGTKLFISEGQVSRYYFGKWPFPENTLKGLSPPTTDLGISLLKSMLIIQPEDRPTAAGALGHGWLAGLKSDKESSRDNEDRTILVQSRDESSQSRKRKNRRATYNRSKKRSRRNSLTQDSTSCILPDMAFVANAGSQMGADPPATESMLGTPMMTPSDAASTESAVVQMEPQASESVPHTFWATYSKSPIVPRKQIRDIPQTYHQGSTSNTKLILFTNRVADKNWLLNPRQPSNDPNPDPRNSLQ